MQLTPFLSIIKNPGYYYRIWGYWRSPGILKYHNLWSDRQDQRFRNMLLSQRGKGKSRAESIYEKLSKPKYSIKWVREKKNE
jgi:hypothetical protein